MLDDGDAVQRKLGIDAGHAWLMEAERLAVYTDYGISAGMDERIELAHLTSVKVVRRHIGKGRAVSA